MTQTRPTIGNAPINATLLLTAREPIAHHDPGVQGGTNHSVFRRAPYLAPSATPAVSRDDVVAVLTRWTKTFTVPQSLADEWRGAMRPMDFMAAAVVKLFLDMHEEREGKEVWVGALRAEAKERSRLDQQVAGRIAEAANGNTSMRAFFRILSRRCGTQTHGQKHDDAYNVAVSTPDAVAASLLQTLAEKAQFALADARIWRRREAAQNEMYRAKSGDDDPGASVEFSDAWTAGELDNVGVSGSGVVYVPEVSANSIRHAIRDGAVRHMLGVLGLDDGKHRFPPEVDRILENGGALTGGSQASRNDRVETARSRFPILDLLAGCLPDTFLGESALKLRLPTLVCRETAHAGALPEWAGKYPEAAVPAADMVATKNYARHSRDKDAGNQMPYGFETLVAGSKIVVGLHVQPFADQLTVGCLVAAIRTWLAERPYIGGISGSGCGRIDAEWVDAIPNANALCDAYEAYLRENAEELTARLVAGTLGDADEAKVSKVVEAA